MIIVSKIILNYIYSYDINIIFIRANTLLLMFGARQLLVSSSFGLTVGPEWHSILTVGNQTIVVLPIATGAVNHTLVTSVGDPARGNCWIVHRLVRQ